jgi:exodeoxyribonuclease-3
LPPLLTPSSASITGIRALKGKVESFKGSLKAYFDSLNAEIIAFQETKVGDKIETVEEGLLHVEGYESFWSICKRKAGYSGVVTYVKKGLTVAARADFGRIEFESEGRLMMTDHGSFVFFNIYFPNSGNGDRLEYKMDFYKWFEGICDSLLAEGRKIIVAGDVNTTHTELDIWCPEKLTSGGLFKEERVWMDHLFERTDKELFIDSFRKLHPTLRKYTWWDVKSNQRVTDQGYRLDYFLINESYFDQVKESEMMTDQLGSDHCPIYLELQPQSVPPVTSIIPLSSEKIRARQPKILSFFAAVKKKPAPIAAPSALPPATQSESSTTAQITLIDLPEPASKEKRERENETIVEDSPETKRAKLV